MKQDLSGKSDLEIINNRNNGDKPRANALGQAIEITDIATVGISHEGIRPTEGTVVIDVAHDALGPEGKGDGLCQHNPILETHYVAHRHENSVLANLMDQQ
jgi:hypothetical protein